MDIFGPVLLSLFQKHFFTITLLTPEQRKKYIFIWKFFTSEKKMLRIT